jgi:carbon-monoxide dehydrogenase large subunit
MPYTGQSLKRFEDPKLVTGHGSFVDDVQLPDMLYAAILRSPHAHARLHAMDVTAARNMAGVVTVLKRRSGGLSMVWKWARPGLF